MFEYRNMGVIIIFNKIKEVDVLIESAEEEFDTGIFRCCSNKLEFIELVYRYLNEKTVNGKFKNEHELSDMILKWRTDDSNITNWKNYNTNIYFVSTVSIVISLLGSMLLEMLNYILGIVLRLITLLLFVTLFGFCYMDIKEFITTKKQIFKKTFYKICIEQAEKVLSKQ